MFEGDIQQKFIIPNVDWRTFLYEMHLQETCFFLSIIVTNFIFLIISS